MEKESTKKILGKTRLQWQEKIIELGRRKSGIKSTDETSKYQRERQVDPKKIGTLDETYTYRDKDSIERFRNVRYKDPKGFRLGHFTQKGWVWNIKGVQLVPYKLPELLASEGPVFLFEGEKDVENANSIGLTATCPPMGAGVWREEYNEYFKGRDVVIVPHLNDPYQEGEKHANQAANSLNGATNSTKIMGLPNAGTVAGFDFTNWCDAERHKKKGVSNEELKTKILNLASKAELYDPEEENYGFGKVVFDAEEFLKIPTPKKEKILAPWVTEKQIILISGARGVGKSMVVEAILDAVTKHISFCPWMPGEPVNCLYCDAEMVKPDLDERIVLIKPDQARAARLMVYSSDLAIAKGFKTPKLNNPTWRTYFQQFLLDNEVKLWVADNISALTPGTIENVKEEWDPINEWLLTLRFLGITTILIHHTGKLGTQRGTSAREDNVDISITLEKPADYQLTDGCRFNMIFTKARLRQAELQEIHDLQFQLKEDSGGNAYWKWGSISKELEFEVAIRLNDGMSQAKIHEDLDISKSYVSKLKVKAFEHKIIDSANKLTEEGLRGIRESE